MGKLPVWDPFTEWRHADIRWIRVDISKEDMKRFTRKSDIKGLIQTFSFLLIITATASLSYYAFAARNWLLLVLGLYLHGMVYSHFGNGIHELAHNTVFASKPLNKAVTIIFGLLYWPYNPFLYRVSHVHFHHQYTLHQNSDGEDVPNYVELNKMTAFNLFFKVLQIKSFIMCVGRLITIKPLSKNWRMRGYRLDSWEKFVLERATEKERREVYRFAALSLAFQLLFAAACILSGHWFLIVLISLAPFYGPGVHGFMCGIHQHACCEANHPDFRISCGDAVLDPISSILYWRMEYHIEHHMFSSIPCYNLKAFSVFAADQLPKKEFAVPRIFKLAALSREVFGSKEEWRENFGRYKGF